MPQMYDLKLVNPDTTHMKEVYEDKASVSF